MNSPAPTETALLDTAQQNLQRLAANPYPGRGIVIGKSADGSRLLQLYWIMGRSENSRNRHFVVEDGKLRTRALDPARVENPDLVTYTAMDSHGPWHVVTNGDQTDTVISALADSGDPGSGDSVGGDYRDALRTRRHEHDAPHHTPRIAAAVNVGDAGGEGSAWMASLRADPADAERTLRGYWEFEGLPTGCGWCLTTYAGDGSPLPSFTGSPYLLPLTGAVDELPTLYWETLDASNRVALALKSITPGSAAVEIQVVNRHSSPQ